MELARTALLRRYELGAEQLLGAGYSLLVIESKCRHTHPLRFGDRVRVGAAFLDVEHRLHIAYDIHNLSREQRAAYGHTMLATVDSSGRLQLKTPDAIVERILRR
jgi:acyl-CoA thioesterase FadM